MYNSLSLSTQKICNYFCKRNEIDNFLKLPTRIKTTSILLRVWNSNDNNLEGNCFFSF